ncbi:hypothetical protein SERLA73DRAFT_133938, partial [Serpula lacrymans var. lacrymans S7.3]
MAGAVVLLCIHQWGSCTSQVGADTGPAVTEAKMGSCELENYIEAVLALAGAGVHH